MEAKYRYIHYNINYRDPLYMFHIYKICLHISKGQVFFGLFQGIFEDN